MTRPTLTLKKAVTLKTEEIQQEVIASNKKSVQVVAKPAKHPLKSEPVNNEQNEQPEEKKEKPKKKPRERKKDGAPVPPTVLKLCERFPKLFNLEDRKPLKLEIHKDILEALKDDSEFIPDSLSYALHYYTKATCYDKGLKKYEHRFDLNGEIAGKVSDPNPRIPPVLVKLCEQFPKAFSMKFKQPLKAGIEKDILREMKQDPDITPRSVKGALLYYIRNKGYQIALAAQDNRIDLNGEVCGSVKDESEIEKLFLKIEPEQSGFQISPIILTLCERFPKAFNLRFRKPLKLRIHKDILEALKDDPNVTWKTLKGALGFYIRGASYQLGLINHEHRYDLNGEVAGEITKEQKDAARINLKKRKTPRSIELKKNVAEKPIEEKIED